MHEGGNRVSAVLRETRFLSPFPLRYYLRDVAIMEVMPLARRGFILVARGLQPRVNARPQGSFLQKNTTVCNALLPFVRGTEYRGVKTSVFRVFCVFRRTVP